MKNFKKQVLNLNDFYHHNVNERCEVCRVPLVKMGKPVISHYWFEEDGTTYCQKCYEDLNRQTSILKNIVELKQLIANEIEEGSKNIQTFMKKQKEYQTPERSKVIKYEQGRLAGFDKALRWINNL